MAESGDLRGSRSEYLLGGRRVKVADLLSAGLLEPGATLVFRRRRADEVHRATVLETGHLRLEDGRTYPSLSRAAAAAAGVRALDGWHAWFLEPSGASMDTLRQRLLDKAASEATADEDPAREAPETDPRPRHEWLKDARAKADAGQPVELAVRELLDLWRAQARGHDVSSRIETELANHGLSTSPHWQKVTLDAKVRIEPLTGAVDEVGPRGSNASTPAAADEAEDVEVGLTVGNLPSALGGICSVKPTATLEEAVTMMLLNDYSQLAVMAGSRSLKGAISWKSIAQARHANPSAALPDALTPVEQVPYDRELIDLLPTLYAADFVLVQDQTGAVCGIVTAADVVSAYGELATPFFLIGELDQLLRRLISQVFNLDDVRGVLPEDRRASINSFDQLAIGDYQQVLQNPNRWARLGWPLDRAVFGRRLDELREVRNDIMHFNPDPIPPDTIAKLRGLIRVIRDYGE